MCVVQTRWGLGLPVASRPEQTSHTFAVVSPIQSNIFDPRSLADLITQLSYAGKPFYPLTLAGYKLALCLGYLRFIEGARMRGFRILTIVIGVSCVVIQVVFVLLNLFSCLPVSSNYAE